jgi:hypothetical protein
MVVVHGLRTCCQLFSIVTLPAPATLRGQNQKGTSFTKNNAWVGQQNI